jgi:hypothetical protein
MLPDPLTLKAEATQEIYRLIDEKFRKLPRKADGSIDEFADGFYDNDVDALRHAYVSGVFTQTYNEGFADICGHIQEFFPGFGGSSPNGPDQKNMDLWNNSVGRELGKRTKDRSELFSKLLEALKKGELIIDPKDPRKFREAKTLRKTNSIVAVVKENESGRNQTYYDFDKREFLDVSEFVTHIKSGNYPGYELRTIGGQETPVAKKDSSKTNNLG